MTDLQEMRDHVLKTARRLKPGTPNGDWQAVLVLHTPDEADVVPLAPMKTDEATWTHAITRLLPGMVVARRAQAYALLDHVWASNAPEALAAGTSAVDPHRHEQLIVVFGATVAVGAPHQEIWTARIERRRARPPVLGPWRKATFGIGDRYESLHAALVASAARDN